MTATNQFAAHVGLDWADKKHDVCVQFKNGERVFHVIEHTPEALDVWLTELHQKVKGRIAIALELKKGPVVYALQKYPFITVFPVHALSLARYRQAFSPSGAKDDPQDAELALELMLRYLVNRQDRLVIHEKMPPGTSEKRHFHSVSRQFFFVLNGILSIELEGEMRKIKALQGLEIPPGSKHQARNDTESPVEFIVISHPTT